MLKDHWVYALGAARGSPDIWHYEQRKNGGLWVLEPDRLAKTKLTQVLLHMIADIMQCRISQLPSQWVKGKQAEVVLGHLANGFYRKEFMMAINSIDSYRYTQFSCGMVVDNLTHEVFAGRQELCLGKNTGYEYPGAQLQAAAEEVLATGICLDTLMVEIRDYEKSLGTIMQYTTLPQAIADKLNVLRGLPCMKLLEIIYGIFEDLCFVLLILCVLFY